MPFARSSHLSFVRFLSSRPSRPNLLRRSTCAHTHSCTGAITAGNSAFTFGTWTTACPLCMQSTASECVIFFSWLLNRLPFWLALVLGTVHSKRMRVIGSGDLPTIYHLSCYFLWSMCPDSRSQMRILRVPMIETISWNCGVLLLSSRVHSAASFTLARTRTQCDLACAQAGHRCSRSFAAGRNERPRSALWSEPCR